VDRLWQAFLRRFDIEHTFRLFKQVLGWTTPKIRSPQAADRWTWLIIAVYAQLRLARPLAEDLRLPWERPARRGSAPALGTARSPGRLTPARVAAASGTSTRQFPASQCAETRPARPRAPAGVKEPPRTTPRRRESTKREPSLKARRERSG
jgi:hypothetical protein